MNGKRGAVRDQRGGRHTFRGGGVSLSARNIGAPELEAACPADDCTMDCSKRQWLTTAWRYVVETCSTIFESRCTLRVARHRR